ncbi:MAG: hypothetical protein J7K75_09720 [Desulfuromonas sp.]|nr:hypothetical protein [Desulfuromonas sp.]
MTKQIDNNTFKGIKPTSAYQRIAQRYQPAKERPQQEADKKTAAAKQVTRRFIAMRDLINNLKQQHTIYRFDYISAEQEIRDLGLETIAKNLPPQLSQLGLSRDAVKQILRLVEDHTPQLQLSDRTFLATLDHSLFPELGHGLKVLTLALPDLLIPIIDFSCIALAEQCQSEPIASTLNNLYLSIVQPQLQQGFQLTLSIAAGVVEVDMTGRRAFLYQRANHSFGLYADKQINLEI